MYRPSLSDGPLALSVKRDAEDKELKMLSALAEDLGYAILLRTRQNELKVGIEPRDEQLA